MVNSLVDLSINGLNGYKIVFYAAMRASLTETPSLTEHSIPSSIF